MATVSALLLLGLAGTWRAPGVTMDEGIVLEYPELIIHGEIPFRDFQSSYGPGTYLPLAAAYQAFGPSVTVERGLGVAYRLAIVLAVVALLWPVGAALAVIGGSLATLAIVPVSFGQVPVAYGWDLALACLLWGLWSARRAMLTQRRRLGAALWGLAGLLVGAAASARPDLGAAALISASVFVVGARAQSRALFGSGFLVGASPLAWNIATAGWSHFWSYAVLARLHQLPLSGYPFPTGARFLLITAVSTLALALAAVVQRRRHGTNPMTRGWLALAALSVVSLPQLFQRADAGHFAFVAVVSIGMLPLTFLRRRPTRVVTVAVPLLAAIAAGIGSAASAADTGFAIHNAGRAFAASSPVDASAERRVIHWLDTNVRPGRKLFVGPADLRWAFFAQTELYFLNPALRPAGFYLEFGPGDDTSTFTQRLIDDLRSADILVLNHIPVRIWRDQIWPEARIGSEVPNEYIRRNFRRVFSVETYAVWRRSFAGRTVSGRARRADDNARAAAHRPASSRPVA